MKIVYAEDLAKQLPLPATSKWKLGVPFVVAMTKGSMVTEYCALRDTDYQTTHDQDELYFILNGHAVFESEHGDQPIQRGAAILVHAGEAHRFKDMSKDFAAWVVFWGPSGGDFIES